MGYRVEDVQLCRIFEYGEQEHKTGSRPDCGQPGKPIQKHGLEALGIKK